MRRIFTLILLLITGLLVHAQPHKFVSVSNNLRVKIPSSWIAKLRHYRYKQNNTALLEEFESFLKPDSLFMPNFDKDFDKAKGGILNPIFTDLDGEPGDELLCLLGWDKTYPSMGVFKKIQNTWYLVYLKEFYMFYSMPELNVANSYSKNKTFYYREVYGRGSGTYEDGYSFFKLINNKVYKCLTLPNETRNYDAAPYLNQEISMRFDFNGSTADEIWAFYKYDFSGSLKKLGCDSCSSETISIIKGENGMNYIWDAKRHIYKAEISPRDTPDELTKKKILCFSEFTDSLFVSAFKHEIMQVLKSGTGKQRSVLKRYLAKFKNSE